jgi:hypothetical protein
VESANQVQAFRQFGVQYIILANQPINGQLAAAAFWFAASGNVFPMGGLRSGLSQNLRFIPANPG